jgi:hypothetical protein
MMIPQKHILTKAFVVESPKAPFVLQDVVLDEVRESEVLVEMKYTGICHTVSTLITFLFNDEEDMLPWVMVSNFSPFDDRILWFKMERFLWVITLLCLAMRAQASCAGSVAESKIKV